MNGSKITRLERSNGAGQLLSEEAARRLNREPHG
jgi:hypothetical protein